MKGKQPKHRVPLMLMGLLGGQMLLMSLQARQPETGQTMLRVWTLTALAPFLSTVNDVARGVAEYWHDYADLRHAREESKALRRERDRMQIELHRFREQIRLSQRLREFAKFQQSLPVGSVLAQVVGRDVTGWFQTIVLNKGEHDGIQLNGVVLTPDGLVGRITALGPYNSQVQLITDDRSGAGAMIGVLSQSRVLGVVEGYGRARLKLRFVPGSEPITNGEMVYTSGQDKIFPRGIPIGRVVSVENESVKVSHDIALEPLAHLDRLEEVIVLLNQPDTVQLTKSVVAEN